MLFPFRNARAPLVATLLLPALLAGCGQAGAPAVRDGWVRLAAVPGRPAAGYFTLRSGARDETLTAAASPAAGRVELHETMKMGGGMGAMTMKPLSAVAVPAGGEVKFQPGGRHLMLFDVAPTVKPGDRMQLRFALASGRTLTSDARVIAAGDAPPQ